MKKYISPSISSDLRTVGNNISLYRRMNRISAADLAQRAHISKDTLSRLERGEPGVSLGTFFTVCRVLGISNFLIDATEPSNTAYGRAQLEAGVPRRIR